MSKFYTVKTDNAFAALGLSDDDVDTILPSTKAPKVEVEVEVKEETKPSPKARGARGGARGGAVRGGAAGGPVATDDPNDKPNNRPRDFAKSKRGGRDGFVPRDASKKTFDRKTNPQGMKKLDNNDPEAEIHDKEEADVMVVEDTQNENSSETPAPEVEKVPAGPKTITMDQYIKSLQGEIIDSTVSVTKTDNTELNREIADAGFQALDKKKVNPLEGGVAPGTKKVSKSAAAPTGQDFFQYTGKFQTIRKKDDRFDDKRDERKPREPKQEKKSSPKAPKVVPTANDFPELG